MSNPSIGIGDRRRTQHARPFILVKTGLGSKRHIKWAPNADRRHGEGSLEEVPLKLRWEGWVSQSESMDSVLGRGKCACVQKPIIETLVRDADTNPEIQAAWVLLTPIMIKIFVDDSSAREAHTILRPQRLSRSPFPWGHKQQCRGGLVPWVIKACTGKTRLLCLKIFCKHKVKQREADVFIAGFLEPFTGTSVMSFSAEHHYTWCFQTYFTMKSFYVKYLMGIDFPGTFFIKMQI